MENEIKKRRGRPRKVEKVDVIDVKISSVYFDKLKIYGELVCSTPTNPTEIIENLIKDFLDREDIKKEFEESKDLIDMQLEYDKKMRDAAKLGEKLKERKSMRK